MATTTQVPLAKAWRAGRNRAYVRQLLLQREPAFAAALGYAEQHFSYSACSTCPNRRQDIDSIRGGCRPVSGAAGG
jgi:hypothetical protein